MCQFYLQCYIINVYHNLQALQKLQPFLTGSRRSSTSHDIIIHGVIEVEAWRKTCTYVTFIPTTFTHDACKLVDVENFLHSIADIARYWKLSMLAKRPATGISYPGHPLNRRGMLKAAPPLTRLYHAHFHYAFNDIAAITCASNSESLSPRLLVVMFHSDLFCFLHHVCGCNL